MADPEGIGDRIQMARTARGLSQRALAEISGIGKDQIGLYESGRRHPREARIAELASTLQVGAHWLATGGGESAAPPTPDDEWRRRVDAKLDAILSELRGLSDADDGDADDPGAKQRSADAAWRGARAARMASRAHAPQKPQAPRGTRGAQGR